jgi:hypothetical protein
MQKTFSHHMQRKFSGEKEGTLRVILGVKRMGNNSGQLRPNFA